MSEKSVINCKICKVQKDRYLDKKYADNKNKRWIDFHGKAFNGKTCPDCHKASMKSNMQVLRAKAKQPVC